MLQSLHTIDNPSQLRKLLEIPYSYYVVYYLHLDLLLSESGLKTMNLSRLPNLPVHWDDVQEPSFQLLLHQIKLGIRHFPPKGTYRSKDGKVYLPILFGPKKSPNEGASTHNF